MSQPKGFSGNLAPLYKSEYYMPQYRVGEYGNWRISIMGFGHDHGYWSGVWMVNNAPILMRRSESRDDEWSTWMSLTPHEMESQELGVKYGFGHTVVMGLGLGWFAANAGLNPKIDRVTVVERDPSVIELFNASGALDGLPKNVRNKITVVCEDALMWKSDAEVDFLYVDIWKNLNEPSVVDDVRKMQHNLHAKTIYYWGQELTLYNEIKDHDREGSVSYNSIQEVVSKKFNLPLFIPRDIDYPGMIGKVVENRTRRGINI